MADGEIQPGRRRWGWVRTAFNPGTSLVFARDATPEQVIRGFRLDPAAGELMTRQQAARMDWGAIRDMSGNRLPCPFVRAGSSGNWAFAEDPSYLALNLSIHRHNVLAALSAGSEALEVLWTPKPNESVEYYADGVWTVAFEPYAPSQRHGSDPDRFVNEMRQAGLQTEADRSEEARARVFEERARILEARREGSRDRGVRLADRRAGDADDRAGHRANRRPHRRSAAHRPDAGPACRDHVKRPQ